VNGSAAADTITITPSPIVGNVRVNILGVNTSVDVIGVTSLVVNGLGGPDTINGSNGLATLNIPLVIDGGPGDDTIGGGDGDDMLIGGDDNDTIDGNRGNDTALMGEGDDTFIWDPGDGNDTIEGQDGADKMIFNGANIGENIDISANGSRARFTRNIASITMDLNGVERIDFNALGGADNVVVNDLTGTDVTQVNVDLASTPGGNTGDGQPDAVTVNGAVGADTINITAIGGAVEVSGLAAVVRITQPEPALDQLIVNGLAGVDTITTGPGVAALILVTVNQD
jgi:hypothetical protein